jgi:hypothetical protein
MNAMPPLPKRSRFCHTRAEPRTSVSGILGLPQRLLGPTAHRDENLVGEFTNSRITQPSESATGLHEDLLVHYRNVLAARRRVDGQSGLSSGEIEMSRSTLVNTSRQRNNQDRGGPFMTISRIHGYNNYRSAPFSGRVRR